MSFSKFNISDSYTTKGLQRLLIASAVSNPDTDYLLDNTSDKSLKYNRPNRKVPSLSKLSSKQLSDYEEPREPGNAVSGKISINNNLYIIDGSISYDENGIPVAYKGSLSKDKNNEGRRFSTELETKILTILLSPYRKVNPGEQTTSTFHKIVLEDPNEWYKLDKYTLFEEALYTLLYFKRISDVPDLYDEKVVWFSSNGINIFIYHLARLVLNNRIYDKFNGFEIQQLKIAYGEYIPRSIIYNGKEYLLSKGDRKEILTTILSIGSENNIFTQDEINILNALIIRVKEDIIPKVEKRHSRS